MKYLTLSLVDALFMFCCFVRVYCTVEVLPRTPWKWKPFKLSTISSQKYIFPDMFWAYNRKPQQTKYVVLVFRVFSLAELHCTCIRIRWEVCIKMKNTSWVISTQNLPLRTHHSKFITLNSSLTTQNLPSRNHHSELTTQELTAQNLPLRTHHSELATQNSSLKTHHSELATQNSSLKTHDSELATQNSSFTAQN